MADSSRPHKIVSGGQTGVDQAALNVAIFLEIPHGGWCPKGRICEDGTIPDRYDLRENRYKDYAKRTEQNVIDSDATLVLYLTRISGGTLLTSRLARKHRRPVLTVDLNDPPENHEVRVWCTNNNVGVLNIAGPRESSNPGIGVRTEQYLANLFSNWIGADSG